MSTKEKYEQTKLPMVPIRDVVIFPFMMVPFVIGRESSVNALETALHGDTVAMFFDFGTLPSMDPRSSMKTPLFLPRSFAK